MDELIVNLEEDFRVSVPSQAEEAVVNFSDDIVVKVRQGQEVAVELTLQGPQGPQGPIGDVTPAAIAARDTAVAAMDASQDARDIALAKADEAADDAAAAETAFTNVTAAILALGLPASHTALDFLRRKADNSGFEYRTPAQVRSDISAAAAVHAHVISDTTGLQAALDSKAPKAMGPNNFQNGEAVFQFQTGGDVDLNWKKIADVTMNTSLYSAAVFEVEVLALKSNYGAARPEPMLFYASMVRSTNVLDNVDNATVAGPSNDFVRVVKTATGVYELQVRTVVSYQINQVTARCAFKGSGTTVTWVSAATNGSTTGTIYTAPTDYAYGGYMREAERIKLAGVATNANNYAHPTGDGNLHVPATGTDSNLKVLRAGPTAGSASWQMLTKADIGLSEADNTSDANKPVSTAQQAALDQKAPLASPALTGTPTAPTAANNTNTNQIATTAFVKAAIDALLGDAPGALDTLNELAAALGDDPNFATTVTTELAAKLNSSVYTAADVLAKLLTVDGAGSGLDADRLDGLNSTDFLRSNLTSLTLGNPGVGNASTITFTKANDQAGIRVTETAADSTLYEFFMADNPDSVNDAFQWIITDWKGPGGTWLPMKFSGINTTFDSLNTSLYGGLLVDGNARYSTDGVRNTYSKVNGAPNLVSIDASGFTGGGRNVYHAVVRNDGANVEIFRNTGINFIPGLGGNTPATSIATVAADGTAKTFDGVQVAFPASGLANNMYWTFAVWAKKPVELKGEVKVTGSLTLDSVAVATVNYVSTSITDALLAAAVSQADAEAGTATSFGTWSAQRVRQAVAAYAAPKGKLVGGAEEEINGNTAINAAKNGKVLVSIAATASTWTLDAPATLGAEFLVFISNTGLGDLTVAGTFDNGETEVTLEQGQSMALTCNGTTHRLLLRGGGAGGGGAVIPVRETLMGNGGAVYTLTNTPASKDAMLVFVGGVIQAKANFEIDGNQLTLGGNVAADEKIEVQMLKGGASVVGVAPLYKKHAGTGTAGPFTLQAAPAVNEALTITWNGLIQPKDGSAYTVAGDQVTFSEAIPVGTYWEETIVQAVGIGVPNPESVGAAEIKAADVAAIRTKLDVAHKQSSASDATAGRGLVVGAFGLNQAIDMGTVDLNTLLTGGSYFAQSFTNGPATENSALFVTVERLSDNYVLQIAHDYASGSMFRRVRSGGSWFPWRRVFTQSDILGTVSQSGGIPTGRIIETGGNANGEYTKFADGTLICRVSKTVTGLSVANTTPGLVSGTYPHAFISEPSRAIMGFVSTAGGGRYTIPVVDDTATGYHGSPLTNYGLSFLNNSGVTITHIYNLSVTAIGRWF